MEGNQSHGRITPAPTNACCMSPSTTADTSVNVNNNSTSITHNLSASTRSWSTDAVNQSGVHMDAKKRRDSRKHCDKSTTQSTEESSKNEHHSQNTIIPFLCGITAGVTQAGLFNPYDRALYLSVKHKRPFLSSSNFNSPYLGFLQSVSGRALSGGLFFPLESLFSSTLSSSSSVVVGHGKQSKHDLANFLSGSAAGAVSAFLLNPLSAIKYRTWGREANRGVIAEALIMWNKGGIRPFFHGLLPTLTRDVAFGGTYTFIRLHVRESDLLDARYSWIGDTASAALAAIVSGPFNLARNVQYATRASKQRPSINNVLSTLVKESFMKKNAFGAARFLQRRLRIGWGTARVAAGMAFGQSVYDLCMNNVNTLV